MATAKTYDPALVTGQGYSAQGYDAKTADAVDWNVDGNQLVQNQVGNIVANDSPLMQQAATSAKQGMAQRGLLNSSMAVGAGQNAVIAQALQMAQQDASTYAQSAQFNAQQKNQVGLFNAEAANQAAQFGAGQKNQFALTDQQQKFQAAQAGLDREQQTAVVDLQLKNQQALQLAQQNFQASQAVLDRQQQTTMAEVNNSYAQLAQLSSTAASIYNQYNNAVQQVLVSDLTTEAKQSAINQMTQFMKVGVQLQGSINGDVDLMKFFDSVWGAA